MPFDTRLIAIGRSLGEYAVISQFDGHVEHRKLSQSGRFVDVSGNPGYRDFAAILSRDEFPQFIHEESSTSAWFTALPSTVFFIIVVSEEWESGMA
jgi:hypothetical protein